MFDGSFARRLSVVSLALASSVFAARGKPSDGELFFRAGSSAFAAENRAQGLDCRVSAVGLALEPRSSEPSWTLALRTRTFGRAEAVRLVAPRVAAEGARATLDHGALVEWFENRASGIEHGWTIEERLQGDGPFWIVLEHSGGFRVRIEADARSVLFERAEATVPYRNLRAWDARGRELPARFVEAEGGLAIEVDDQDALYPVTVDPTFAWLVEGNQANSGFGFSVSTAGDVNGDGFADVIVGAPAFDNVQEDEGRAFVYLGSEGGLSSSPAWTGENDNSAAEFGNSVSTAGDVNNDGYDDVIVGARGFSNVQMQEGQAYLYLGSSSGLASSPAWMTAETNGEEDFIAYSVSTAGDVNGDDYDDVIVGGFGVDNGELDEGRAYVYLGSATGLAASPAWTVESDQESAFLGVSVSTAGDVNGDGYDDVIVGASAYDNGQLNEGRAFVYLGSGSGLATSPAWTAESNNTEARFGFVVATAGDVNGDSYDDVLVGTPVLDNGQLDEGRVYLYLGSASGLASTPAWTMESNQAGAWFGHAVRTAGDVNADGYDDFIVGARLFDNDEGSIGRIFLFLGSDTGPSTSPIWIDDNPWDPKLQIFFGAAAATAGDVNDDGYDDVIVGPWGYSNDQFMEGAALVYMGAPSFGNVLYESRITDGTGGVPASTLDAQDNFGEALASLGDLDGDGIVDLAVGAAYDDDGGAERGAVYVLFLERDGTASSLQKISDTAGGFTGTLDDADLFGAAVANIGDLDDDGVTDLAVGAPDDDDGGTNRGAVWILLLNDDGTVKAHQKISDTDGAFSGVLDNSDEFGISVEGLGDLDDDGVEDLAVGAYGDGDGGLRRGAVWILFLNTDGTVASHQKISDFAGNFGGTLANDDEFGRALAEVGDLDGDGVVDLVVAAAQDSQTMFQAGALWVLFLTSSGSVSSSTKITEAIAGFGGDLHIQDQFGISLADLGDVGGPGVRDLAVGAYGEDESGTDAGAVWILSLDATGNVAGHQRISDMVGSFAPDLAASDRFGLSVASLGDLDQDGRDDLAVGALEEVSNSRRGAVWILFLNDGTLELGADQTSWDGSTDTQWALASNWSNGVPDATRSAIIPDAVSTPNDPAITTSGEACDALWIQPGGTLDLAAGSDRLQVFGGATVQGPITGTGELVFAKAGTLAGNSTIASALVSANEDLTVQGGPLQLAGDLAGDATVAIRPSADLDVGGSMAVLADLVLDGTLSVGDSLDVDGGLLESVAGEAGGGSLHVGGSGECVEVGQVDYGGFVITACSLRVENNSPSENLVFDLDNGWPNSVVIDVAGSITILTQDLSIGGDLTLAQGTLEIGAGVETLTIAGDVTIDQGTLSVGSDIEFEANAVTVEAGALLEVTGRQLFIPAPIPVIVRGTLAVGQAGELLLESNTVTVESGGTLRLAGGPGLARMSGLGTARYTLDLQAGSTLAANNFAFTQMSASGIVIANAVTIAPSPLNLRNGVFDRPANGGVLLDVSRTVPTEFRYLRFENSGGATGANNVHVPASSATITMTYWSGAFGGPAFEDDPGAKLDWGLELGEGVVASPKLGATAPSLPTFPIVVGDGGVFTEVGAALASLAGVHGGERVTLELAPGVHAPFTIGPELACDLSIVAAGNASIDVSAQPVRIADLPAGRSVELVGLVLDAHGSPAPALVVQDAEGVVLLEDLHVRGARSTTGVELVNARAVVLQGGSLEGSLALARGSRATASAVQIASIELAGGSLLETRGIDVEPFIERGSRWLERARAPELELAPDGAAILVSSRGPAWLLVASRPGFRVPLGPSCEGVLLLDRPELDRSLLRVPDGRARWTLPLLASEARVYLQAVMLDRSSGRLIFSDVESVQPAR